MLIVPLSFQLCNEREMGKAMQIEHNLNEGVLPLSIWQAHTARCVYQALLNTLSYPHTTRHITSQPRKYRPPTPSVLKVYGSIVAQWQLAAWISNYWTMPRDPDTDTDTSTYTDTDTDTDTKNTDKDPVEKRRHRQEQPINAEFNARHSRAQGMGFINSCARCPAKKEWPVHQHWDIVIPRANSSQSPLHRELRAGFACTGNQFCRWPSDKISCSCRLAMRIPTYSYTGVKCYQTDQLENFLWGKSGILYKWLRTNRTQFYSG